MASIAHLSTCCGILEFRVRSKMPAQTRSELIAPYTNSPERTGS
ncbi:hypothetical protein [Microcoleus sp. PH2017_22_RUC_O_B]|nr:hypothetical protein [Microcoleus sp. PH2017_22_RUC_O_B]